MAKAIEEIDPKDFKKRFIAQDFKVLKIKTSFDLQHCLKILADTVKTYPFKSKDQYTGYKGIGLHYSDETNPIYDSIDQVSYIDKDNQVSVKRNVGMFLKPNEIGRKFNFVDDYFSFLKLGRGRILLAEPGFKLKEHCDGSFVCTLHFPLISSLGASAFIDGEEFYLEPDGSCYLLNAELPHYIENNSAQDRIHIVYSISPMNFRELTESDLVQFQKYFMFFIKNFILTQASWIKLVK